MLNTIDSKKRDNSYTFVISISIDNGRPHSKCFFFLIFLGGGDRSTMFKFSVIIIHFHQVN